MKIRDNTDIYKITNAYLLKSLFSYLYSKDILKIIQKSKKLQNKLNINIENYKKISEFPKYEYDKRTEIEKRGRNSLSEGCGQFISTCTSCIFIIYLLIYAILLITLDTFDSSNTKQNYNKSLENIINKINICLFVLVGCVIGSWAILYFYIYVNCVFDYGFQKILKSIIIIIINIIHFVFEGLVIWKLVISYQILEGNTPWFMKMDYAFLILNFIHILFLIFCTYCFFMEIGNRVTITTICTLKSFNNMIIDDYMLPDNFYEWKEKERKKYVLYYCNQYKYSNSGSRFMFDFKFLSHINNYREKNQIPLITHDDDYKIFPNFIINEPGEIMLYPEKNMYKLSNKEYLFIYPKSKFLSKIEKEDNEICKILLKDNLNYIKRFNISEENEYFLIFERILKKGAFYNKKYKDEDEDYLLKYNNNIELDAKLLDDI